MYKGRDMRYINYIERKPTIMSNATLDYTIRNGFELGTEDYGIANLQMVMSFANEVFIDTLIYVAQAHEAGEIDTNYVSIRLLSKQVYNYLKEQDAEIAGIWGQSWGHIACSEQFIDNILSNWKNVVSANVEDAKESGNYADIEFGVDLEALSIAAKMHAATK